MNGLIKQVLLGKGEKREESCPVVECQACPNDYPGGCLLVELLRIRRVVEWLKEDTLSDLEIAAKVHLLAEALRLEKGVL